MTVRTLINILGAGRSGTTMLDLMLGNDDESFSLGEVHAWFRPFRKHHFQIDCNCGDVSCAYWESIKYLPEKKFHVKAFDKLGVNFLIDSSKSLPWVIDNNLWNKNNDMRIFNLIIYKPLINYIYSIWKRGGSIDEALHRYGLYYDRFFESGLPAYAVSFHELADNPTEVLDGLCDITGQQKKTGRKNFWEKESHHLFGSGVVRKQAQETRSAIQKIEDFPKAFIECLPSIEERINKNNYLSDLLKKLETIDYKARPKISFGCQEPIKKCVWYYQLKAKHVFQKHFPEKAPVKF